MFFFSTDYVKGQTVVIFHRYSLVILKDHGYDTIIFRYFESVIILRVLFIVVLLFFSTIFVVLTRFPISRTLEHVLYSREEVTPRRTRSKHVYTHP